MYNDIKNMMEKMKEEIKKAENDFNNEIKEIDKELVEEINNLEKSFKDFEIPKNFVRTSSEQLLPIVDYVKTIKVDFFEFKNVRIVNREHHNKDDHIPKIKINNIEELNKILPLYFLSILDKDDEHIINKIIVLDDSILLKSAQKIRSIDFKNLEYIEINKKTDLLKMKNTYAISIKFKIYNSEKEEFNFDIPTLFIINNATIEITIHDFNDFITYVTNFISKKFIEYKKIQQIKENI